MDMDGLDLNQQDFGFPFKPYAIQKHFMKRMYEIIDQGAIGIMESPTGTGKSLSTICASLSWLETEDQHQIDSIKSRRFELLQLKEELEHEEDWMNAHRRKIEVQSCIEQVDASECQQNLINSELAKSKQRLLSVEKDQSYRRIFTDKNKRKLARSIMEITDDSINQAETVSTLEVEENLIPSDTEDNDSHRVDNSVDGADTIKKPNCRKIIYASRTHSQLDQLVHELYKTKFRPRVISLGGRHQLCVNETVRLLNSAPLINDRCNQLLDKKVSDKTGDQKRPKICGNKKNACSCSFSRQVAIENLCDTILADESSSFGSIDSLVKAGKELHACPYFSSRAAVRLCQLILVPYNILLHRPTREAWGLDLSEAVIIIDEAHNLLQTVASMYSCELNKAQIEQCLELLQDYIDRFRDRLSPRNFLHIRQLQTVLMHINKLLANLLAQQSKESSAQSDIVFSLPQFFTQLNLPVEISLFRLIEYLDNSKLCRKLRDFGNRPISNKLILAEKDQNNSSIERKNLNTLLRAVRNRKNEPEHPINAGKGTKLKEAYLQDEQVKVSAPFYQLKEFLSALISTESDDDSRILAIASQPVRLKFLQLNPIAKLRDVISASRSLLLIGGTMRPTDQLVNGLISVCNVPKERIIEFSCGHVIDKSNLLTISLGSGPDKTDLIINYTNRECERLLFSIAQVFINLLRHIPNGVVSFFPSYSFLASFIKAIKASGHFDSINKVKPVYFETKENNPNVWADYCSHAKSGRQGAFFMAVVNGRLSEGINFSDELGRCVIMVGLPYPNKNSSELREQMAYISKRTGNDAAQRYYETLCTQAVNQAIGRVIRHKNDYASIVLLDARYSKPSINASLPTWIGDTLQHCSTFPQSLSKIISFFKTKC